MALLLLAALLPLASVAVEPSAAGGAPAIIKGSLEQLYVLDADPGEPIRIVGPGGTRLRNANSAGAHLERDLPAGSHTVTVGVPGDEQTATVTVHAGTTPQSTLFTPSAVMPIQNGVPAPHGYLPTADGTLLDYQLYLPSGFQMPVPPAKRDVVVVYDGYRAGLPVAENWEYIPNDPTAPALINLLLAQGHVVVGVNMRGTGCSGGAFDVQEPLAGRDGSDIVETIAAQPWVDEVALAGASWLGLSQLYVAQHHPDGLVAIAPGAVVADWYRDIVYPGGILNTGFAIGWANDRDLRNAWPSAYGGPNDYPPNVANRVLPTATDPTCLRHQALRSFNIDTVDSWEDHPTDDAYWQERRANIGAIQTPTLLVHSWQDEQVGSRAALILEEFPPSARARLVAHDIAHAAYTGQMWGEVATFLTAHLAGTDNPGDPANTQATNAYYAGRKDVEVLLDSTANQNPRDRLRLDTLDPAAGQTFTFGTDLQADVPGSTQSTFTYQPYWSEDREPAVHDSVAFTSAPLQNQVVMAGSGSIDLVVRADSTDVDLEVTLVEVRPDGREMILQGGWLRASHRGVDTSHPQASALRPYHPHCQAGPGCAAPITDLVPGAWTPVRIELIPLTHVFRKDSRIKLVIDTPGGYAQPSWGWGLLDRSVDVDIAHDPQNPALQSRAVLPVHSGTLDMDPVSATVPPCDAFIWLLCRPVVKPITASVTDGNLVTLNLTSTGADWNLAGVQGLRLLPDGRVADVGLVLANGPTSFRAPPGRHRYTAIMQTATGIKAYRTIEVDVPGFTGADPQVIPDAPHTATWALPGPLPPPPDPPLTWWASLDGQGLHGWTPLQDPQVTVPASLLTPGAHHTLRYVTCGPQACTNEFRPVSTVAGTITYLAPPGTQLSGNNDAQSLVAKVQHGYWTTNIYAGYPGVVWSHAVTVGQQVTVGQELGQVILGPATHESKTLIVN